MGLMDRLKNNRRGADGGSERAPTNFDELQAAVDADEVTAAIGIDSRHGDVGGTTVNTGLTPTVNMHSIISELPASSQLNDYADSHALLGAAGVGAAATAAWLRNCSFFSIFLPSR